MRRQMILVTIVGVLALAGTYAASQRQPATRPQHTVDVAIKMIRNHEYLVAEGNGTSIIHSASCPCNNNAGM